jgi:hypothetical protein
MSRLFSQLAKQRFTTFKVNYSLEYKRFIINYIASDPYHPLQEAQKRLNRERKREGLWWHVTTGTELAKSSCVRSWARRRLRNAIVDELKAHGFDETGRLIGQKGSNSPNGPETTKTYDGLRGGLRLHVQPPLVPAKYVDVKAEVGQVIKTIMMAMDPENHRAVPNKKPAGDPARSSSPQQRQNPVRFTRQKT